MQNPHHTFRLLQPWPNKAAFKRKIISINFKDKSATKRWCRQHPHPVQTALKPEQGMPTTKRDGAGGEQAVGTAGS